MVIDNVLMKQIALVAKTGEEGIVESVEESDSFFRGGERKCPARRLHDRAFGR